MDRPGHARIKPPKAPPIWTGRLPLAVGADSISARGVCVAAGRADIESAPMEVCRGARFQFWKHPCFENAEKRPPALPKAGGGLCIFPAGIPHAGAGAALRPEIPAGETAVFRRWRNKKVAVIKTTTLFGGDDQI